MEDYPRNLAEVEARFANEAGLSGVSVSTPLAGGFSLSAMRA